MRKTEKLRKVSYSIKLFPAQNFKSVLICSKKNCCSWNYF